MIAAYDAWQKGDLEILQKAYDNAKELSIQYAKDLSTEWESRRSARQLGINEFQAKTNYLLGAYGKLLQAEGLSLDEAKFDESIRQFENNFMMDQLEFEQRISRESDDAAREWAKITGYYVDEEGNLTPTADFMIAQLRLSKSGGGGGGGGGGAVLSTGESLDPFIILDDNGNYAVDVDALEFVATTRGRREEIFRSAYQHANQLNNQKQAESQEQTPSPEPEIPSTRQPGSVPNFNPFTASMVANPLLGPLGPIIASGSAIKSIADWLNE